MHTTGRVSANDLRKSRLLSDMQRLALVHMSGDPPDAIRLAPFYRSGGQQKAQLLTSMPLVLLLFKCGTHAHPADRRRRRPAQ